MIVSLIAAVIIVAVFRKHAFKGSKAGEMLLDIILVIVIASIINGCLGGK